MTALNHKATRRLEEKSKVERLRQDFFENLETIDRQLEQIEEMREAECEFCGRVYCDCENKY